MGGFGSGVPVAREAVEHAIDLIEEGLSMRESCKRAGIDRKSLKRYLADPMYRRIKARCPDCGAVVRMPCVACQTREAIAQKSRRRAISPRSPRNQTI